MKKVLIYIGIFITFIIIYLLQSNLFVWFNIAGIMPNLFIILVLFCGLFTGKKSGLICGFIIGILLDLFLETKVLIEPIMLGIVGFVSGILSKIFSKENRFNIMIMVIALTFAYETSVYVLKILLNGIELELLPFIKIIFVECFFNAMLTIIIYPIFQYFGLKIEDKILGNKMLRYF